VTGFTSEVPLALDIGGEMLVVSQFTLYGDCRRGRRPSYSDATPPEKARELYEYFVAKVREQGVQAETGIFQEMMDVEAVNYGPVTLLGGSKKNVLILDPITTVHIIRSW